MRASEMSAYDAIHQYSDHIGYVHFRNICGKVPDYYEVFVDEGDVDMLRVLRLLAEANLDGVIIPDHSPQMSCDAPWHTGMAYTLGWIREALQAITRS